VSGGEKELRLGVIGCGGMATQVHCPNVTAIAGARTVAYCDVAAEKAQALLDKFGGEYVTTDAARIFDDKSIDGVLIQVGPKWHARFAQMAAMAGKHVFVEKPIAVELADALDVVRAVEASGVKFLYGTNNRLAPLVLKAKAMCPQPLYSFSQCSESITHHACHFIDLAVNLFHEAPLERVYASGGQFWNLDPHLPADSFCAVLTFADRSTHTCIYHGASFNPLLSKYHYQLFGRECCVYLARRFKECHLMKDRNQVAQSWVFHGDDLDRGPFGYMGHYQELKHWVDCIRTGASCTMTARNAAYVLAIEKAILHSIQTGRAVNVAAFLREHDAAFLQQGREGVR